MGASKELMLRMTEEWYMAIPQNIRETFLTDKRVDVEHNDWSENMNDETFERLYNQKKAIGKDLSEREYQLREERRKQLNK